MHHLQFKENASQLSQYGQVVTNGLILLQRSDDEFAKFWPCSAHGVQRRIVEFLQDREDKPLAPRSGLILKAAESLKDQEELPGVTRQQGRRVSRKKISKKKENP